MAYVALVVDDDPSTRLFCRYWLTGHGFLVLEAGDGASALDMLRQQPVDLVLLDWLLPGVSGDEVLRYIHQSPSLQETQVVVMSAHDHFRQSPAVHFGDHYLVKPVLVPMISDLLRRLFPGLPGR